MLATSADFWPACVIAFNNFAQDGFHQRGLHGRCSCHPDISNTCYRSLLRADIHWKRLLLEKEARRAFPPDQCALKSYLGLTTHYDWSNSAIVDGSEHLSTSGPAICVDSYLSRVDTVHWLNYFEAHDNEQLGPVHSRNDHIIYASWTVMMVR